MDSFSIMTGCYYLDGFSYPSHGSALLYLRDLGFSENDAWHYLYLLWQEECPGVSPTRQPRGLD